MVVVILNINDFEVALNNMEAFAKVIFSGQDETQRLAYSSFNSGNHLEVHMEKYVIPPILSSDFKLPANLLSKVISTFG